MQTLKDFGKEFFNPKPDQIKAIAELDKFLSGTEKVFILKGYAGTGKTTLTKLLAAYINCTSRKPVLMAPTGRAARIMFDKTGFPATTIHKAIYNMDYLDEIDIEKEGKVQYKFRYNLKPAEDNVTNVYIVDEASMVSDKYSEDNFFVFGSGIILQDLLTHIAPGNLARKDKLLFIGDDAQLPPVTDAVSGALSIEYLLEKYNITAKEYQLTEVIRQSKESGILENATRLRALIKLPGSQKLDFNTGYEDVRETKAELLVQEFCAINPDLNPKEGILLVSKNKTALEYNLAIRAHFFSNKSAVQPGETFLINQNNYNYEAELLNGMLVKVIAADEVTETKSHMMSYGVDGKECFVSHRFRWVTIEVPQDTGKIKEIRCKILDSFLFSPEKGLDYAENIALYLDFKLRHPTLKVKTPAFKDALRADPYFNALKVKFGYAITVHKAQGGEWEKVLVDMDFYSSYTSKAFLRWVYTAITRSSKQLIVFNVPTYSIFKKLQYRDDRPTHDNFIGVDSSNAAQKLVLRLPVNYDEFINRLFTNTPAFLIEKYHTLLSQLQESGIEITNRRQLSYAEEYCFEKENKLAYITFYYNGRNQFTRVLNTAGKQQDAALLKQVNERIIRPIDYLIHNNQVAESTNPPEPGVENEYDTDHFFTDSNKQFMPLFTSMLELAKEKNITIQNIDHVNYVEKYYFIRDTEKAMVHFWYDGHNQFTTAIPHLPECNSNKLLEDLAVVIKDMMSEVNS